MNKTCSVEGCNEKHAAKGYCNRHYRQYKKYGYVLERSRFDKNEIIEYEDYAEVVLYDKNNKEKARALIDLEDVDLIKNYKWSITQKGYVYCSTQSIRLHRLILGCPEDFVVDHINHNKLDNRKDNLRICTTQQNNMNQGKHSGNTSGITGVYWHKSERKWYASIGVHGRLVHLGRYATIEEAIVARQQAEIEYFGEFAPTNNPEEPII